MQVEMTPDSELLRQFAKTDSEDAFAELVRRHVNLVYSAALRQVNGDAHLAQDVAQTVFTDLARKAGSLARRETLTGWLYTSAHFAAAKIARTETRRRDREEKFMRDPMHDSETSVSPVQSAPADWEQIRPALDDAMHELKQSDREAILLRYFENRPFGDVGLKLGLNENAARMRVERALEKLRVILAKHGITTTAALASAISANAVQMAPAGLAATLTATSITTAGTGTLALLKIMTATQIKLGLGALVVAGAATALVVQHQNQTQLRHENESLRQQITRLSMDNESLSNQLVAASGSQSLPEDQLNELLRLRSEVGTLRRQTNELARLRTESRRPAPNSVAQKEPDPDQDMEVGRIKLNNSRQFLLAMILFANDNQGAFPTNFDQVASYVKSDDIQTKSDDWEIVFRGSLSNLTNAPSTIVVRESKPWLYHGKRAKVYGFADGHSQLMAEPDGGFDAWEQQHLAPPIPNQ